MNYLDSGLFRPHKACEELDPNLPNRRELGKPVVRLSSTFNLCVKLRTLDSRVENRFSAVNNSNPSSSSSSPEDKLSTCSGGCLDGRELLNRCMCRCNRSSLSLRATNTRISSTPRYRSDARTRVESRTSQSEEKALPVQRRERRFVLAGIRQQGAHPSGSTESGAWHVGARRCATGFALRLHATGSGSHVSTAFHGDGNNIFSRALSNRLGTNGRSESAIGIRVCGRLTRQRARPLRNRSLRHRWRLGRWRRGRRMSRLPMIRFHLSLKIVYRTDREPTN